MIQCSLWKPTEQIKHSQLGLFKAIDQKLDINFCKPEDLTLLKPWIEIDGFGPKDLIGLNLNIWHWLHETLRAFSSVCPGACHRAGWAADLLAPEKQESSGQQIQWGKAQEELSCSFPRHLRLLIYNFNSCFWIFILIFILFILPLLVIFLFSFLNFKFHKFYF